MADAPSDDPDTNPLDRQRDLMALLSQETRHSIVQTLLGHPSGLASADEINYFVANKSKKTIDEQLERLEDAGVLGVYEHAANKDSRGLPWLFFGFTEYGIDVLGDFNYQKGVPMARAVHAKTRKTEKIERHQSAPRPELPDAVVTALRLDGAGASPDKTTEPIR